MGLRVSLCRTCIYSHNILLIKSNTFNGSTIISRWIISLSADKLLLSQPCLPLEAQTSLFAHWNHKGRMENTRCFCSIYPKLHYPLKHLPPSRSLSQVCTHTKYALYISALKPRDCRSSLRSTLCLGFQAVVRSRQALTTAWKHKTHAHLPVRPSNLPPRTTNELHHSDCAQSGRKKGDLVLILTTGADTWLLRRERRNGSGLGPAEPILLGSRTDGVFVYQWHPVRLRGENSLIWRKWL